MKLTTRDLLAELIIEALNDHITAAALRCLAGFGKATSDTPPSVTVSHFLATAPAAHRDAAVAKLRENPLLAWNAQEGLAYVTLAPPFTAEWREIADKLVRFGAALEEWSPPDPASPLTSALHKGALLFNHHLFFEVHEVLEAQWVKESSETKRFLQGLIQVAVAFYHQGRGNPRGALSLLQDGIEKIAPHQPAFLGLELREFIAHLKNCEKEFHRLKPEELPQSWVSLIPQLRFVED